MKKIILFILCILIVLSLFGCYENDDFAPYESYSKTVDKILSIEMVSLSDIIPEIDIIAKQQQENLILTSVTMIFEGRNDCEQASGIIVFGYAKPHDTRNQISKMDVYFNTKTKAVEKFDWEKGHGKRISCITDEIGNKYINLSLPQIIACFNQNSEYKNKIQTVNPQLKIELNFNRLFAYLYDLDNPNSAPIFRCNESDNESVDENLSVEKLWQKAYAEFIEEPNNYIEREHFAGAFALVDIDNDGTPELIIAFFNGIEGGYIFANIYSYDSSVKSIGQRIDMYYKSCWISRDPLLPGLFVEGGRNSTFSCNYWSIKENKIVDEPLWTDAYNSNTGEMEYKDLSNNLQLITEAKKVISIHPEGTVEFFEISEINIQKELLSALPS